MSIKLTDQQQQDLLSYIEGTLAPDAAARMEVFLANTDPRLAAEIADMMDQRAAVASLPKLKAPSDMTQRIMEQVERESLLDDSQHNLDMRPWWQSRWLMAASVAMVVTAFGYYVIHEAMKNSHTMDQWQVAAGESTAKDKMTALREDEPAAPQVNQAPTEMQVQQAAPAERNQYQQNMAGNDARVLADAASRQVGAAEPYNAPRPMVMAARNLTGNSQNVELRKQQLHAAPENDVIVTLAARDASDVERLRLLLVSMSGPTTTAAKAMASSAPARSVSTGVAEEKLRDNLNAATNGDVLRARLTPEAFRRIVAQFAVVNVIMPEQKNAKPETVAADAVKETRDELAAVPYSGETNYVFHFVPAKAEAAANTIAPAAAPAASQPAGK